MAYKHPDQDWFEKQDLTPPKVATHGTPEEIRKNLKSVNPRSWHLEGNLLIAETDLGPLKQTIPPDYICAGTDEKGLPILKKVVV